MNRSNLDTIEITPRVQAVVKELRKAILTGGLRPGAKLRQEDLAVQLGVSRMPVRQALAILEREDLVQIDPFRGAIVRTYSADDIRDIYKFREVIERYVAETLAARRFDVSPIRKVVSSAKTALARENFERLIDLDVVFHTQLYDAVRNQVLSEVMSIQWARIRRVMFMGLFAGLSGFRDSVWDEHADILDAIAAGNPKLAGKVATSHMATAVLVALKNVEILAEPRQTSDIGSVRETERNQPASEHSRRSASNGRTSAARVRGRIEPAILKPRAPRNIARTV